MASKFLFDIQNQSHNMHNYSVTSWRISGKVYSELSFQTFQKVFQISVTKALKCISLKIRWTKKTHSLVCTESHPCVKTTHTASDDLAMKQPYWTCVQDVPACKETNKMTLLQNQNVLICSLIDYTISPGGDFVNIRRKISNIFFWVHLSPPNKI